MHGGHGERNGGCVNETTCNLARSFCSQLGGVGFCCPFVISFAIVPEVSITLVMNLMSHDFWGML